MIGNKFIVKYSMPFKRFLIYGTRRARSIPMEVPADDINDNTHRAIDPALPTKVIVHGFGSHCHHLWVYDMRSALMSIQDCNIGIYATKLVIK